MKPPFTTRIRRAWRELSGQRSFAGADISRLTLDWLASLKSADEEIKRDILRLRARARQLARDDGYVENYLGMLAANVIGHEGFTLQSQVRDSQGNLVAELNSRIEAAWRDWAEGPVTVDGRMCLVDYEQLGIRTLGVDGESISRIHEAFPGNRHGLALQGIDADAIDPHLNRERGPGQTEIRMGVEVDSLGAPVAYWVSPDTPTRALMTGTKATRIPAEEIIHVYVQKRINQTRGVTWLHPCMMLAKMLDGYEEAELVAARVAASKMGFFQSREGTGDLGSPAPKSVDAAPGSTEALPPGWEFAAWDPQHPTTAYGDFVKALLRKLTAGLKASYNLVANDLEGVNYSSLRSGRLAECDVWRIYQAMWRFAFRRRVYSAWLRNATLSGTLALPSVDYRLYDRPLWTPRGWPWVDPLKEVMATILAVKNLLGSRTKLLAEQGTSFETILEQLAQELKMATEKNVPMDTSDLALAATLLKGSSEEE